MNLKQIFSISYFNERNSEASWHFNPKFKKIQITVFLNNLTELLNDVIEKDRIFDDYSEFIAEVISLYSLIEYLCFHSFIDEFNNDYDGITNLENHQKKYMCQKMGKTSYCFFQELCFYICNYFCSQAEFEEQIIHFIKVMKKNNFEGGEKS